MFCSWNIAKQQQKETKALTHPARLTILLALVIQRTRNFFFSIYLCFKYEEENGLWVFWPIQWYIYTFLELFGGGVVRSLEVGLTRNKYAIEDIHLKVFCLALSLLILSSLPFPPFFSCSSLLLPSFVSSLFSLILLFYSSPTFYSILHPPLLLPSLSCPLLSADFPPSLHKISSFPLT